MKFALLLYATASAFSLATASALHVVAADAAAIGSGDEVGGPDGYLGEGGDPDRGPAELLPATPPLEVLNDGCIAAFKGRCPNGIEHRGRCRGYYCRYDMWDYRCTHGTCVGPRGGDGACCGVLEGTKNTWICPQGGW